MTQVSLVANNQSYQGTLAVLKLLKKQLQIKLKGLDRLVIKINFVSTRCELATTPFETVKAFIEFIKPIFSGKIVIAEEATIGDTQAGFGRYGFRKLADETEQVEVFDSARSQTKEVKIKYPHGELRLPLAKIYTQAPFLVSICRAKTHDAVVATLGIKNLLVGAIRHGERFKVHQGKDIHWILAAIARHTYPDLVIVDGVEGMEGNGPVSGKPIKAGWLVASLDALAADSLAVYLMGFDVKDIGYLNLLRHGGFGKLYLKDEIEIIGDDPSRLVTPFKPHSTFEFQRQWL
jgi:uncharacterized protein (DUF362 family)